MTDAQIAGTVLETAGRLLGVPNADLRRDLPRYGAHRAHRARRWACYALVEAGWSLNRVGRAVGRHHTTIKYRADMTRAELAANPRLAKVVQGLVEAAKEASAGPVRLLRPDGVRQTDGCDHQAAGRLLHCDGCVQTLKLWPLPLPAIPDQPARGGAGRPAKGWTPICSTSTRATSTRASDRRCP